MNQLNRFAVLMPLLLLMVARLYAQDPLFIDTAGRVGIGINQPKFLLHVASPNKKNSQFAVTNSTNGATMSMLSYEPGNVSLALGAEFSTSPEYPDGSWVARSESVGWLYQTGHYLKLFGSNNNSRGKPITKSNPEGIVIDLSNSNVGIGTFTNLNDKLTVEGNIKARGKVYDNNGEIIPRGVITLWYGNTGDIPKGWALCDGNNGTPDLVDRFVLGAGVSAQRPNARANKGDAGGRKEVALGAAEMPAHTHDLRDVSRQGTNSEGSGHNHINAHNENFRTTAEAKTLRNGAAFNIMPPYYALCYIMKL